MGETAATPAVVVALEPLFAPRVSMRTVGPAHSAPPKRGTFATTAGASLRMLPQTWIFCLFPGCTPDASDTANAEPPATAHWMADVFADESPATIGKILLPGAFNSTSYACDVANGISPDAPEAVLALWGEGYAPNDDPNRLRVVGWARHQDRSLGQQFEDGIRFVEMNVTMKDGVVTTWHSVYGVPLDEVLDDVVAFAVAWPDEVVVITFGLSIDSADYPVFTDLLVEPRANGSSLCDLVYTGPENAAEALLPDVRASGRNLIWSPDGELRAYLDARGDCPTSQGTTDRTWSITVSPEGVAAALASSVDSRVPEHLLVNDFAFSLDGSASVFEQANYILSYDGVEAASSALGFDGDFPGELIATYNTNRNMNVLAGAYYQDTNLIEAAIAENEAIWGGSAE